MFKTGNFLFRREIIHYTNWQNLFREEYPKARSRQRFCRDESGRRGAGRISAGRNPEGAELAEPLPGGIQTARGWQNLCREEYRQRGAGRTSAETNTRRREAGRISAGKNPRGFGQTRGLSLHAGTNQCGYRTENHLSESVPAYGNESMWVSDGQQITPRGLSLHEGANQCVNILIFHLSLPRANSGGTPACRDRPRVCPPPSVRQGRNKHVIRQTTNDCACIRLPRDGRTDTGKNPRGYRTDTGSVPTCGGKSMWVSGGRQITPSGSVRHL